jgi:hypothetical protein
MLVKNVSVELKRSRLDLITNTDRIKIVLCEGVKKAVARELSKEVEKREVFLGS